MRFLFCFFLQNIMEKYSYARIKLFLCTKNNIILAKICRGITKNGGK